MVSGIAKTGTSYERREFVMSDENLTVRKMSAFLVVNTKPANRLATEDTHFDCRSGECGNLVAEKFQVRSGAKSKESPAASDFRFKAHIVLVFSGHSTSAQGENFRAE